MGWGRSDSLCQVQICFLGGTLLRSPPGPLPFHSLTPSSPSQSIHKRFLFWLSHEDMESIHHTPSPWSPSFTLLPPRRSPPSATPPHPHTYCPLCIAASFLIPLYVDVSRCFRSCSHRQSCLIWSPKPLLSLSLSFFSSQPPIFNSSQYTSSSPRPAQF
jgi:hypothetical protein